MPITFFVDGAVLLFNGTQKHYAYKDAIITSITLSCQIAPTGSDIQIRINKNGSLLTVVSLSDGSTFQQASSLSFNINFGDYFTIDVLQNGSTYPGYDLSIYIISEV